MLESPSCLAPLNGNATAPGYKRPFQTSLSISHLATCIYDLSISDVHEVVVPLSNLLVEVLSTQILVLLKHLPDILNDELAGPDRLSSKQAMALGARTLLQ